MSTFPPGPALRPPSQQPPYMPQPRQDFEGKLRLLAIFYTVLASIALLICLLGAGAIPFFMVSSVHTIAAYPDGTGGVHNEHTPVSHVLLLELVVLVLAGLSCVLPLRWRMVSDGTNPGAAPSHSSRRA